MLLFKNILSQLPSRRIIVALEDKKYINQFDLELTLLNYTRLRFLSYLGFFIFTFLLYTDYFAHSLWERHQLNNYIILDITGLFATILIFVVTHINKPKSYLQIKTFHRYIIYIYVVYYVGWCSVVSGIESATLSGFPTFLIGVLSASILFIFRRQYIVLVIISSMFILLYTLRQQGMDMLTIFQQFYAVIGLIVLAYLISRVLLYTRVNSFIATIQLERTNKYLDDTVRERTEEYIEANKLLTQEIKVRKRYEQILIEEKKKAEEAVRLKSVFLANISHEIRTPLNGILGFAELLLLMDHSKEKRTKYINVINSNSRKLLGIIENIIDISIIETDNLELSYKGTQIVTILQNAYDTMDNYRFDHNKEHVQLKIQLPPKWINIEIVSDAIRIEQVLSHLLVNAIKFTDKGSVSFGCTRVNGEVEFFVEDTGIGLDKNHADFIFDSFRQLDESATRTYGGNGLGLSISKGIIEKLGGKIWFDRKYKSGARFCFTIPLNATQEKT